MKEKSRLFEDKVIAICLLAIVLIYFFAWLPAAATSVALLMATPTAIILARQGD